MKSVSVQVLFTLLLPLISIAAPLNNNVRGLDARNPPPDQVPSVTESLSSASTTGEAGVPTDAGSTTVPTTVPTSFASSFGSSAPPTTDASSIGSTTDYTSAPVEPATSAFNPPATSAKSTVTNVVSETASVTEYPTDSGECTGADCEEHEEDCEEEDTSGQYPPTDTTGQYPPADNSGSNSTSPPNVEEGCVNPQGESCPCSEVWATATQLHSLFPSAPGVTGQAGVPTGSNPLGAPGSPTTSLPSVPLQVIQDSTTAPTPDSSESVLPPGQQPSGSDCEENASDIYASFEASLTSTFTGATSAVVITAPPTHSATSDVAAGATSTSSMPDTAPLGNGSSEKSPPDSNQNPVQDNSNEYK